MKDKHWLALAVGLAAVGAIEIYLWQSGREEANPPSPMPASPLEFYPHLRPGETAPAFDAERLGGGRERIDFPEKGGKTFLFILSLTCGTCAKTVPLWNRLARESEGRARVFGVVVDTYQNELELMRQKNIAFPTVRFPSKAVQLRYKVTKVPQTLLIGPGGKVEKAIVGLLSDAQVEELLDQAVPGGGEGP